MDTSILRGPLCTDRQIRGTPFAVDTFQDKICVVRCIHAQGGRAWIRMSKKTHTNPLSKREIEALRKNPNVAAVSTTTVKFTEEFKRIIYEGKKQGVSVSATLRQNGIDPEILGPSRVEGLSHSLNKKAKQQNSFADRRSENYRRPPKTGEETVEQRIRQLENELAYTRQEVEFLKKLQAANMEANGVQYDRCALCPRKAKTAEPRSNGAPPSAVLFDYAMQYLITTGNIYALLLILRIVIVVIFPVMTQHQTETGTCAEPDRHPQSDIVRCCSNRCPDRKSDTHSDGKVE